jgi:hypothetical protein
LPRRTRRSIARVMFASGSDRPYAALRLRGHPKLVELVTGVVEVTANPVRRTVVHSGAARRS